MWYRQRHGLINNATNIYEIWLTVEYAMTDLTSAAKTALTNDHRSVSSEPRTKHKENRLQESSFVATTSSTIKPTTTPAITIVEL